MAVRIVFLRYKFAIQAVVGGQRAHLRRRRLNFEEQIGGNITNVPARIISQDLKKKSHNRIAKIRDREIKQYNSIQFNFREREMEAKKAAAGTSLESLMSSFNTRIAELQDLVIARNSLSLLFFVQSGSSTSSSMDVDVVVCKLQCTRRQA